MTNENDDILRQRFDEFFIQNFPKVKNFARMLLKSEEEAEDIAQDIFIGLWQKPQLWMDDSLQNYLYTVTKNRVLNVIKHRKVKQVSEQEITRIKSLEEIIENPLDRIYYKEIALILKLTLEQMPKRRSQIFRMSRFEGMNNAEIAQKLELSVRTVEHHIYLALSELKKILISILFLLIFK